VRFSLQDVKRQIRRRDSELTVILHFLRSGELRAEIGRLVAFYEQQCGQPRRSFAQDEASALVGDYRMANCLLPVLSAWYSWRQPLWAEIVSELSEETRAALDGAEIRSPVALRLALFAYVNAHHAGFLDAQTRSTALAAFASLYQLDVSRLEGLLALDTEDVAVLAREASAPPTVDAVAALYNQWVFEAALFNASEVHFVIDCEAFLEAQREDAQTTVTGIGAVVKRLCYLARKLGVYYDLSYAATLPGTRLPPLHLTLYGPQEMTGSPQQYGQRLARLCRLLLAFSGPTREQRRSAVALAKALRQAEATVHIFQNAYHFQMGAELLALLPAPEQVGETVRVAESATVYDSNIEQSFAEAFAALERGNGVDGWQLEREPEPLLLSSGADNGHTRGIFIPDFALTRGKRRIYVEILGFWTPGYRERKRQKLQLLKGRADLILALPVEAHPAFASLAADFPLVEYREQLSATELLRVLQTRYDDFEERMAGLDETRVHAAVRAARFIPERSCYELLHCYRRSELPRAAARVLVPEMAYTPGLGLYLLAWLEHIHLSFVEWIEAKDQYKLSLSGILQECQLCWPELAGCDESSIEALLCLWPEVQIQRASIFEALLLVEAHREHKSVDAHEREPAEHGDSAPGKMLRERRAASKKRSPQETSQQNLWELEQ
jgi:predicted nuclease of restriction endonuclease-like RecB superfamily